MFPLCRFDLSRVSVAERRIDASAASGCGLILINRNSNEPAETCGLILINEKSTGPPAEVCN